MGNIFSASEIVEIGIQIERNGKDFYEAVAKLAKDSKAIEVFSFLAREEDRHIQSFTNILSQIKKYEPSEAYPGEYFTYLKALSDGYVFTKENKGQEAAENIKTELEAVELGIGFEKDSILFYHGMKRVVLEPQQKIIDRLIEEEQGHLRTLAELKRNM